MIRSHEINVLYQRGSRGLPGNLILGYQNIEGGGHGKQTLLPSPLITEHGSAGNLTTLSVAVEEAIKWKSLDQVVLEGNKAI